jgi:3-oxoacyl-[acyl-carrier protein] reductase
VLLIGRDEGALQSAVAELGNSAFAQVIDVTDNEAATTLASVAPITLGRLDGVLVNAGGPPAGDALRLTDEQWRHSYELLLGGPIRLVRELAPLMTHGGSILFITSSSVRQPIPGLDSSNVLRPSVTALAKCLARELAPGIRVNSIAPGRLDTERVRSLDQGRATSAGISLAEQRERTAAAIPLGRYGNPAELGRVAVFLLSQAASYITGTSFQVDGGLVTAIP